MDCTKNTINNSSSVVVDRCLLHHRLATYLFAQPFLSNGCLCWLPSSGFQQTCYSMYSL
jgi:hypothetical protein